MTSENELLPLFEAYPGLRERLPHVRLGTFPTPVEPLRGIEESIETGGARLYIKRDDLSGVPYGGNKVRKLEFLLAHIVHEGYRETLTFGGAGSNHALATAIYGRQLGLACISMLIPQPNAHGVRKNLLMSLRAGAELHHCPGMIMTAVATLKQLGTHKMHTGRFPYLIAPGGTCPLGMIGTVSAVFELKAQIARGELPEPDVIYAASGTMGTVVGLMLGVKAAGLAARVVAVRVTQPQFTSLRKAARLFRGANRLLHRRDAAFPLIPFPCPDFTINHDFYGEEYGRFTPEAVRAIHLMQKCAGIEIEGTYTGKTVAALLADVESGALRNKTALFWNTHNSHQFSADIEGLDYHDLPKDFHRYFEEDVQPLDRASPS